MPERTLQATSDQGVMRGNTASGRYGEARSLPQAIASEGVSDDDATMTLARAGIARSGASGDQLAETVEHALHRAF